jgi:hypothetical protein
LGYASIIRASKEVHENLVASVVDVGSIFLAYSIGIHQLGFEFGIAYALFDAWIVIWMRKPITRMIKRILTSGVKPNESYSGGK